jgi:aminoglycoside phosphotransferase family enzyme
VTVAEVSDQGLARKVAWLCRAQSYPDAMEIIAIETHMSWVFLTDGHAYKLKKPVRHDYLDFSTLAAREHFCREEVRLNRPLAPGVYLGVVPLTQNAQGELELDGRGEAVEWLVKMRRLDRERMLDRLIKARAPLEEPVRSVIDKLVQFYRQVPAKPMSPAAYLARCEDGLRLNRRLLMNPVLDLPVAKVEAVHDGLLAWQKQLPGHLAARAGRIVEGHGDLRPEHICLETPPLIYDRLEFNLDFRIADPWEEISFLAMECEHLDPGRLAEFILALYAEHSDDRAPAVLCHYYMAVRACVRARLAALHVLDRPRPLWPRWLTEAREYLQIAERHWRAIQS